MDFIIFYGPTGVGKTDLALELGKHIPIEIINADVGQLYEPLNIGTAKPAWKQEPIPHHLFDVVKEPVDYNAHTYRTECLKHIDEIKNRQALPCIVGGTGFYLKSLFFPVLEQGQTSVTSGHWEMSWSALATIDPVRAAAIHPNDKYRIERALVLWYSKGILPSQARPQLELFGRCLFVYLDRESQDLRIRINQRIKSMLQQGWIDEVRNVSSLWKSFLKQKGLMGYRDIVQYIENNRTDVSSLELAIERQTWAYARRQRIFWRSLKKSLQEVQAHESISMEEINLSVIDVQEAVHKLIGVIGSLHSYKER